jgi:hypothetical protein
MASRYEPSDPCSDVATVAAARSRLDGSLIGYNRHAGLAAQFRRSLEQFERLRERFESTRAAVWETLDASDAIRRTAVLERLRAAREAAAFHRSGIELGVRDYVHSLRHEGLPPEKVLVAVKGSLDRVVTPTAPDAPRLDAAALAEDVSRWAIAALFDAA